MRETLTAISMVTALLLPLQASAQATTVFSGQPSVKVSEGGTERRAETLSRSQASNLGVVVSRIGDKYYWSTRANKELTAHAGGAFVTFLAVDGSGYVRVIAPGAKGTASQMSPAEEAFDYVEHVVVGLRSITYYGKAQ
jgi:hypothetical protein